MNIKSFKTLDEQIDILKDKGLIIDDVDYAKDILLRENYFFLSGYRQLFLNQEIECLYQILTLENCMLCLILTDKLEI